VVSAWLLVIGAGRARGEAFGLNWASSRLYSLTHHVHVMVNLALPSDFHLSFQLAAFCLKNQTNRKTNAEVFALLDAPETNAPGRLAERGGN